MIADFWFESAPDSHDVVVELFWQHGERMGRVILPPYLEQSVVDEGLPDLAPLPVISAVAYAMVLAARNSHSLKLSGDEGVWSCEWGRLVRAH